MSNIQPDLKRKSTKSKRPDKRKLEEQCWYHGLISRKDAESLLSKKGDFVVRGTEVYGAYRIVLSVHTGERVAHFTINPINEGRLYQISTLKKSRKAPSVYDLVQFYKVHPLRIKDANGVTTGVKLGDGIPRPKWLVRHESVCYDATKPPLGSGNFADVYIGTFTCDGKHGKQSTTVAIKVIKAFKDADEKSSAVGDNDQMREAMLSMIREGKVMSFYSHENVVQFFGVACNHPPVAIVMEYCPGGSLEAHLNAQKANIVLGERVTFCLEAAQGMRYLHSQNCIHRDLAARNCLIGADGVVKISDFGLCKVEEATRNADDYMTNIPVRWMAPETLVKPPKFSKKSDVWAYGVLLYEVFNLGVKPWPNEEVKKIATNIRHGIMPEMPSITPAAVKDLVQTTWLKNREERPSFKIIVKKVRDMQKGELKPPDPAECSVNRINNVHRTDYSREETATEDNFTQLPSSTEENEPTITAEETEKKITRRRHSNSSG
uniref:Tyrosine-protein kinase n=2 Tax=Ascaris TaxID=6251 RepID=F1KUQ7_ASCSU